MIRFIDLGKQIGGDDETGFRAFAFFNTVSDRFIELNQIQVWNSLKIFKEDHSNAENNYYPLERFLNLIPDWVPEEI